MAKISFAEKLKNLFSSHKKIEEEFFEDLTDALIEGDVGAKNAMQITDELEEVVKKEKLHEKDEIYLALKNLIKPYVKKITFTPEEGKTNIYMVLGVNGVGKTTSLAKMGKLFSANFSNVVFAASDTFRAAAVDQIAMHAEKLGIRLVKHQMGSDPSAVVFDAAESVSAKGGGLVLADTAGRLHNKDNLISELKKIDKVASSKASPGCYKKILVIDATTGQNAVRQAEVFHEAVGLDALVLTKYDSTAKGGEIITIGRQLGIPLLFICFGEKYDDIKAFDEEEYLNEFLGL